MKLIRTVSEAVKVDDGPEQVRIKKKERGDSYASKASPGAKRGLGVTDVAFFYDAVSFQPQRVPWQRKETGFLFGKSDGSGHCALRAHHLTSTARGSFAHGGGLGAKMWQFAPLFAKFEYTETKGNGCALPLPPAYATFSRLLLASSLAHTNASAATTAHSDVARAHEEGVEAKGPQLCCVAEPGLLLFADVSGNVHLLATCTESSCIKAAEPALNTHDDGTPRLPVCISLPASFLFDSTVDAISVIKNNIASFATQCDPFLLFGFKISKEGVRVHVLSVSPDDAVEHAADEDNKSNTDVEVPVVSGNSVGFPFCLNVGELELALPLYLRNQAKRLKTEVTHANNSVFYVSMLLNEPVAYFLIYAVTLPARSAAKPAASSASLIYTLRLSRLSSTLDETIKFSSTNLLRVPKPGVVLVTHKNFAVLLDCKKHEVRHNQRKSSKIIQTKFSKAAKQDRNEDNVLEFSEPVVKAACCNSVSQTLIFFLHENGNVTSLSTSETTLAPKTILSLNCRVDDSTLFSCFGSKERGYLAICSSDQIAVYAIFNSILAYKVNFSELPSVILTWNTELTLFCPSQLPCVQVLKERPLKAQLHELQKLSSQKALEFALRHYPDENPETIVFSSKTTIADLFFYQAKHELQRTKSVEYEVIQSTLGRTIGVVSVTKVIDLLLGYPTLLCGYLVDVHVAKKATPELSRLLVALVLQTKASHLIPRLLRSGLLASPDQIVRWCVESGDPDFALAIARQSKQHYLVFQVSLTSSTGKQGTHDPGKWTSKVASLVTYFLNLQGDPQERLTIALDFGHHLIPANIEAMTATLKSLFAQISNTDTPVKTKRSEIQRLLSYYPQLENQKLDESAKSLLVYILSNCLNAIEESSVASLVVLALGSFTDELEAIRLLQNTRVNFDDAQLLRLAKSRNWSSMMHMALQKQGTASRNDLVSYYLATSQVDKLLQLCRKEWDASLVVNVIENLTKTPKKHEPELSSFVKEVYENGVLSVSEILRLLRNAKVSVLKPILIDLANKEKKETEQLLCQIESLEAKLTKTRETVYFEATRCAVCQEDFSLQAGNQNTLHFQCGHSLHQHCCGSGKCTLCEPEMRRTIALKKSLDLLSTISIHDTVEKSKDPFGAVLQWLAYSSVQGEVGYLDTDDFSGDA